MYKFEQLDLSDDGIKKISDLLNIVFPKTKANSFDYLNWEYNFNPVGKAVGFNAFLNDELAAHYVTQPIISLVNGVETKGLLSLNTATHPDHRGKRLFTDLADKTFEHASREGYEFVIGVANQNSIKGFIKYLGFDLVKPLDVKFGVGLHSEPVNKEYSYQRIWNKELLDWRLSNPIANYKLRKRKNLVYIISPTDKFGINSTIGVFEDNMLSSEDIRLKKSAGQVNVWMGIDDNIKWSKSIYMNFPDFLKPSPLNLIFKDLTNQNIKLDASTLKFQCIDFDAY